MRQIGERYRTLIDLGPLLVFFGVNYFYGIMIATAALMVATLIAVIVGYVFERSIPPMPAVTCVFVVIFGGLTLWLDDELFIKIKPTIVNLLFAGALASGLIMGRNFLKSLLGRTLALSDQGWNTLTRGWIAMFVVLAGLNEIVWRSVETDTWVSFKVFVIPVIVLAFSSVLLYRAMRTQPGADPAD